MKAPREGCHMRGGGAGVATWFHAGVRGTLHSPAAVTAGA